MNTITWPPWTVNPSVGRAPHTVLVEVGLELQLWFMSADNPNASVVLVATGPKQFAMTPEATQAAGTLPSAVFSVTTEASVAPPLQFADSRQMSKAPPPVPMVNRPLPLVENESVLMSLGVRTVVRKISTYGCRA
ncbi:MAG: hypothetical protein HY270_15690 [Deltaproteobacteria bacterium]|nr:hypothetical protein [Deltaproteobacteria bacterium]